jgi:hypothetical protein
MATRRDRFEAKVDRSAEHHLWTGSKKADGTGKMKVDSKAVTAQRIAWDLCTAKLPPGTDVLACPEDRASVRIEHHIGDGRLGVVAGPGVAGREGAAGRSRSGLACGS